VATLELVRLRSKYPNTGLMTVRHTMPPFDAPLDRDGGTERALRVILTDVDDTTTPKVAGTGPEQAPVADETPAGKGERAR
jgi:hypothetical protein